jgi:hypothetical protein
MRALAVGILALALACTARAEEPAAAAPLHATRIVVTFANTPQGSPAPAGTTGAHYGGAAYQLGQSAHAMSRRIASQYSLKEVANWPIKALSVHCVVYEIPDERSLPTVLAALAKDTRVALAQPLQEFHTLAEAPRGEPYNDPLYDLQTNLTELGIARAHERAQGAGVRIGLIDTGVDARHPDLHGRIASTRSFVSTRVASPGGYRHGTAMAGLIAAVANNHVGIVGIAPLAQLEVFEACWQLKPDTDDAACDTFTLAKALAAALDAGVPLINLSLSGPADPLLSALIHAGIQRGVTFVGASAEPSDGFPGSIAGVIIAGSTEHSSWPATLTAPANHVFTLRPGAQYDFESGTSVAAAEVTGAVALIMSATHSRLTTGAIGSLLRQPSGTAGTGASAGAPPVNVNGALTQLDLEQHRGRAAGTDAR